MAVPDKESIGDHDVETPDDATASGTGDGIDVDNKKRKVGSEDADELSEKNDPDESELHRSKRSKQEIESNAGNSSSVAKEENGIVSTGDANEESTDVEGKENDSQLASATNLSVKEGKADGTSEAGDVDKPEGEEKVIVGTELPTQNGDETSKDEPTDANETDDLKMKGEKEGGAATRDMDTGDEEPRKADKEKSNAIGSGTTKDKGTNAKGNPYDSLKYMIVRNDGRPESLIKLVALKSLFAKQLPKMPRAYIARLVFDRRHISLAIVSDDPATKDTDEEVIGAICYRAFEDMRFAEIAFCAVNASHQVKGYGTKLMNLVKQEGAKTGIEYFITYADNYAIGYFKKQGFTKNISMPKGRYQGLIKDYDGGTMMECYVHPSIDFTRIPEMLEAQRQFILSRIRLKARSTTVYDPLPKNWTPSLEGASRGNEAAARAMAVPGMAEAGWTMTDLMAATGQGKDLDRAKNALKSELLQIVRKVDEHQSAWPFREPVDTNEVKDYLDVIKEPIDLSTIDKRIRKGDHYKSKKMLYADLMLMVNNCKLYNDEASTYVHCAVTLEKYVTGLFQGVTSTR